MKTSPILKTGFIDETGLWKIIAILRPRMLAELRLGHPHQLFAVKLDAAADVAPRSNG